MAALAGISGVKDLTDTIINTARFGIEIHDRHKKKHQISSIFAHIEVQPPYITTINTSSAPRPTVLGILPNPAWAYHMVSRPAVLVPAPANPANAYHSMAQRQINNPSQPPTHIPSAVLTRSDTRPPHSLLPQASNNPQNPTVVATDTKYKINLIIGFFVGDHGEEVVHGPHQHCYTIAEVSADDSATLLKYLEVQATPNEPTFIGRLQEFMKAVQGAILGRDITQRHIIHHYVAQQPSDDVHHTLYRAVVLPLKLLYQTKNKIQFQRKFTNEPPETKTDEIPPNQPILIEPDIVRPIVKVRRIDNIQFFPH